MTEIRFYHLKTRTLEEALPALVTKAYGKGANRLVIRLPDAESVAAMNTQLWTYRPDSFLPHGSAKDGPAAEQPIYLTDQDDNPNAANMLICGNAVSDHIEGYDLVCEIFADHDADAVAAARTRWRSYKDAGHSLTYWQQTEEGGWTQKA